MKLKLSFVIGALVVVGSASAQSLNVWLEPGIQSALVGDTVDVHVYTNANGPDPLVLSDAYLTFTWDPAVLGNATPNFVVEPAPWDSSYWAPGSPLNSDLQDGDARRELLGQLPPDQPVAPIGTMRDAVNRIKVTTFQFTVDSFAPSTSVKLWGSHLGETTNFLKGDFGIGQWALVFEQGAYSEALINVVPEPATLTAISLGAIAMLRRRKRQS